MRDRNGKRFVGGERVQISKSAAKRFHLPTDKGTVGRISGPHCAGDVLVPVILDGEDGGTDFHCKSLTIIGPSCSPGDSHEVGGAV
jgi:hypothetical protein